METTVEQSGKHGVKLTVEVPAEEFAKDLDRAYRRVGQQVRVPGFRKGHVPRRIIDAQIGRDTVLDEFVQDALPSYYGRAVREHELAPISDPDINIEQVEEGKPLIFTATMEVRPRLELDDYKSIDVPMPSTEVTERDVDEFVDRLRERFAELESVPHPARRGDYVVIDIRSYIHDVEIEELSGKDQLYEVGSGQIVPELDTELEDKRKGEILKFNATLPERFGNRAGQEVTFQVLLKEVKSKRLPVVDDEFAKMASEFDTLAELREDLRTKLADVKRQEARAELRDLVLQELISRVDVDLPETLVDHETAHRVERAREQAERAGRTLEDVLQEQGWDELRFRVDARDHAVRAIKADLVLEAVARQEGIEVSSEELQAAVADLAQALGRDVKDMARTLERTGQVTSLAGDIIRSKALDVLVEAAEGVSEEGSLKREDPPAEGSSQAPERDQGANE
ncbi:MAG: trigger factor [Actinomycetota bacterium]|nr:trigger factor [Actinomycetota bacterium]